MSSATPPDVPTPPDAAQLYEEAPCGLLLTDRGGTILRCNQSFCQWTGYAAGELVGVRSFQELLTVGGRIFHHTHWAPLLQMQGSVAEVKFDLRHRDGTVVPVVLNARQRGDGDGVRHEIALFVAKDRHSYERELLRARRHVESLLAELTRERSLAEDRAQFAEQMVGIVSHDLRNPLAAISMGAQVLQRMRGDAQLERACAAVLRSTQRAQRMVSDLLDFTQSRIGDGLHVAPREVDLHAVVATAVQELREAHPGHAIAHEAEGPGACRLDPDRAFQVLSNLVSNAVAYGSGNTPVTIRSCVTPEQAVLAVHNLGDPIPRARMATLFDPMVRGSAEGSQQRSVGLGLFIVREIARAHGGLVDVTSSAEAGTCFRAVFPQADG